MGQIQVMSPALANQIAAGEVVERPASCVKELIENSLDAGARKISVKLEEGGIALIAVEDDGQGMSKNDAVLAFARHATSKLKHAYDLTRIHTLGFRGEALASIAAVARVTLQTRARGSEYGWEVHSDGSDETSEPEAVGRGEGTRVEVRDLFFNTPARLKYLRTVQTEQARCVEAVQRAALSKPEVAFTCEVEGRVVFQTPGKNKVLDVLAVLYGVGEARQFVKVDIRTPDYRVQGFVGRPTQGKSSRAHGNWFINNRSIRNIGLHQAVVAGYQGRLMVRRHPMYALYISMDPTLVDVNIHPHKSEVRFSEERDVARLVQTGVRQALESAFLVPSVSRKEEFNSKAEQYSARTNTDDMKLKVSDHREKGPAFSDDSLAPQSVKYPDGRSMHQRGSRQQELPLSEWKRGQGTTKNGPNSPDGPKGSRLSHPPTNPGGAYPGGPGESKSPNLSASEIAAASRIYEGTSVHEQVEDSEAVTPAVKTNPADKRAILRTLRPIGQALATYILAEADDTLYVIDQHAAHERVLYERFRAQTKAGEVSSLPLLTPVTLRLLPQQLVTLTAFSEELDSLGITAEEFGGNEVIVRTIPQAWEGLEPGVLLEELLQQLDDLNTDADPREALREKIVMRACKSAIKANHRLSDMEMRALCEALPDLHDPFHCPHGRPVFIQLTNHDLEKEFRRIV